MHINSENYQEYFVLYADNELNIVQRQAVEKFISVNPDLKEELEQFEAIRLMPQETAVYPDKKNLYRSGGIKRTAPLFRWRYVAAAMVLIIAGVILSDRPSTTVFSARIPDSDNKDVAKDQIVPKNEALLLPKLERETRPENSQLPAVDAQKINTSDLRRPEKKAGHIDNVKTALFNRDDGFVQDNDLIVNEPRYSAPASVDQQPEEEHMIAKDISVGVVKPVEFKNDIIASEMLTTDMPGTAAAFMSTSNADAADAAENPVQPKKSGIKKFLHKTSTLIDKAANLKNTRQVNIRLGKYEIVFR